MTLAEIKDYINRTLPDRTKASDPMYPVGIVRQVLNKMLDFGAGIVEFIVPNGDGSVIPTVNQTGGQGLLRFLSNLISGLTDLAFVNANLAGNGFSFWQMLTPTTKQYLLVVRKEGVGIGVTAPGELLDVAGRIATHGLVAAGNAPTSSTLGVGLGSAGSTNIVPGSTDFCGQILMRTSSDPQGGINQTFSRITFSSPRPRRPRACLLSAGNAAACSAMGKVFLTPDSVSSMVLLSNAAGDALPANTEFLFTYQVII